MNIGDIEEITDIPEPAEVPEQMPAPAEPVKEPQRGEPVPA